LTKGTNNRYSEFYPLLDFDEVVQDKQDISKNLFIDKKTGCPYVLTTTFLITVKLKNGKTSYAARSVKSSKILERKQRLKSWKWSAGIGK